MRCMEGRRRRLTSSSSRKLFFDRSRREVHRCRALRSLAYNRTTRPRSGSCKSSVWQKPAVMRTLPVHDVACPEADIMRQGAEVHARGAANPMTNVSYFVRAGFRCRRRVNPRVIGGGIGNQIERMVRPSGQGAEPTIVSGLSYFGTRNLRDLGQGHDEEGE
jgi:hypothetical protein